MTWRVLESSRRLTVTFEEMDGLVTPHEFDDNGELLTTVLSVAFIDSLYSDRAAKSE